MVAHVPITVHDWLRRNTFHHSQFSNIRDLVAKKEELGLRISVAIPTLNEQETIAKEVNIIRSHLVDHDGLVDEIVVIDSGSTDHTQVEAENAGAMFYLANDVLPEQGKGRGKGENLWKSLWVLEGDLIVWLDADIKNITAKFVYGLVGPLLCDPSIGYVKAFYNRPLKLGKGLQPSGGGRVTEILVRPLLSLYYPDLAYILQPLSGEYAGRREVLESLPFSVGYGVEIGHLLDLYEKHGLSVLGQVDLDLRVHRNRSIQELGRMSFGILQTFFDRVTKHGRIRPLCDLGLEMTQMQIFGAQHIPLSTRHQEVERPPIKSLESYQNKRRDYRQNK